MRTVMRAAHAFDDANNVRGVAARRHEVDQPEGAVLGVELRFENQAYRHGNDAERREARPPV